MQQDGQQADFARLGSELLAQAQSLLFDWLPGGRVVGNEFECGNLSGIAGRSLRVNLRSGKWADFSSNEKGGDLISLFAAIKGISQIEAYRQLGGASPKASVPNGNGHHHHHPSESDAASLVPPPKGTKKPDFIHRRHGTATKVWSYRDGTGAVLYFIARYDTPEGKQFIPWSWRSDGKWINKAWPEPRPLYGLELLAAHPERAVMVVEGEKAADAARSIAGHVYNVVTWQGGSLAWKKTDLTPLYGRKILLWPDADEPGVEAMYRVGMFLAEQCPEVKQINPAPEQGGWDAADALAAGMDWQKFKEWASPRAEIRKVTLPEQVYKPEAKVNKAKRTDVEVLPADREPPSINVQVTNTNEPTAPPVSLHAAWENMGLAMTQKSGPIINVDNVVRILEAWEPLKGVLWFDEFHQRMLTNKDSDRKIREWRDVDDIDLTVYLQRELGLPKMTTRVVREGVELFAFRNIRNEPRDWMEQLTWDQAPRIDHFFAQALGADDSEYTTAASKNFWLAMIARVYRPGCKFDNMVVLEGHQGKFKSSALNLIGGEWFMEATETIGTKDFLQSLNGKLLVEIAELDGFSKADVRTIKKTISCRVDTYRASFGRRAQDFRRRCVFVGTTNEDEYLEDSTGGRRFWPIKIGNIDLGLIVEHRDQLFAEAVSRFKAGEEWWHMPAQAKEEQEARRRSDAWEDALLPWLSGKEKVRLLDVAVDCFKMDVERFDKRAQLRLGSVMRSLGWTRITARSGNRVEKMWVRTDKADPFVTAVPNPKGQQESLFSRPPGVKNYAPGASDVEYPDLDMDQ